MKNKIELNKETLLDIPKLIEGGMVILANSGGGKSYAIRKIAEEAVTQVQTIILDPEGEFASLREKYDFILAGKNADVPVEVRSASLLATKLLELGKSAVIDLYELHPQERQRYVKLFCEAMVNCPKELYHPVIVILDEAHEYVPEGKPSEATWAVESLASKGRKRGQRLVLASQRISKLSKNASAECNNKLIGRASQDIDMKRAGDELGFNKEKLVELRQLKPGEFFAFGPAISDEVLRIKIGEVKTEHAKVGYKNANKVPPPSHIIKQVLGELSDLPAEAEKEARTIKELKAQIHSLKSANKKPDIKCPEKHISNQELINIIQKNVSEAQFKMEKQFLRDIQKIFSQIERAKILLPDVKNFSYVISPERATPILFNFFEKMNKTAEKTSTNYKAVHDKDAITSFNIQEENSEITGPEQKVLNAIRWCESIGNAKPPQELVAFLSGYAHIKSTGYTNPRGYLKAKGLADYGSGSIFLTEAGRVVAEETEEPLTQEVLQREVLSRLDGPEAKLLKILIEEYPDPISNEELCQRSGYAHVKSTGYTNPRGRLRSFGLLDYGSEGVIAKSLLFME